MWCCVIRYTLYGCVIPRTKTIGMHSVRYAIIATLLVSSTLTIGRCARRLNDRRLTAFRSVYLSGAARSLRSHPLAVSVYLLLERRRLLQFCLIYLPRCVVAHSFHAQCIFITVEKQQDTKEHSSCCSLYFLSYVCDVHEGSSTFVAHRG